MDKSLVVEASHLLSEIYNLRKQLEYSFPVELILFEPLDDISKCYEFGSTTCLLRPSITVASLLSREEKVNVAKITFCMIYLTLLSG